MSVTHRYIIGLGSNLGPSRLLLEDAILLIQKKIGQLIKTAPFYLTAPQGGVADLPFLNSAISLVSDANPDTCMTILLEIEDTLGRQRLKRWDNRTIDLDILLWMEDGNPTQNFSSRLATIPHPRLLERDFALIPAAFIAPDWIHPESRLTLIEEVRRRWPNHKLQLAT